MRPPCNLRLVSPTSLLFFVISKIQGTLPPLPISFHHDRLAAMLCWQRCAPFHLRKTLGCPNILLLKCLPQEDSSNFPNKVL